MQRCITTRVSILFWIHVMVSLPAVFAQLQNVAANKNATQSSSQLSTPSVDAARALDGNTDPDYSSGSCFRTDSEYYPYWEVDLGDIYVIDHVKIYKTQSNRTRDLSTEVSVDGTTYTTVCYHADLITGMYTCVPETRTPGRWVKLKMNTSAELMLSLCEVEVMSDPNEKVILEVSKLFKYIPSVKGTGTVLQTKTEVSDTVCAYRCFRDVNCTSVNVLNTSNGMECQLLDSDVSVGTAETNISFWKVYTRE